MQRDAPERSAGASDLLTLRAAQLLSDETREYVRPMDDNYWRTKVRFTTGDYPESPGSFYELTLNSIEVKPPTCDDDGGVEPLAGWRRHTTARFELHLLPGDHFYLRPERDSVLRLLDRAMRGDLSCPN